MSIVLLDEMNLARIEYYFSELLSKLEIRRNVINPANAVDRFKSEIELEYGASSESDLVSDKKTDGVKCGKRLYVGRNILFVGTMNEDESTQTLSSKVIDRSNVLRFGIPGQLMQSPNRKIFDAARKQIVTFDTWMQWATIKGNLSANINLDEIVKKINGSLDLVDRGFGHRTETAIKTYVNLYPGSKLDAIADQIEMKILPRLNGADKDLVQRDVAPIINDILTSMHAEDVQEAFDAILQDDKSAFFSWKGVNR
jgi:5-methylcytosine-specific restriction endonuclease McrBC GTP-binding regulatory subunit McrB